MKIDFKFALQNQTCVCFHTPVGLDKLLRMFEKTQLFIAGAINLKSQTGRWTLPIQRIK